MWNKETRNFSGCVHLRGSHIIQIPSTLGIRCTLLRIRNVQHKVRRGWVGGVFSAGAKGFKSRNPRTHIENHLRYPIFPPQFSYHSILSTYFFFFGLFDFSFLLRRFLSFAKNVYHTKLVYTFVHINLYPEWLYSVAGEGGRERGALSYIKRKCVHINSPEGCLKWRYPGNKTVTFIGKTIFDWRTFFIKHSVLSYHRRGTAPSHPRKYKEGKI